MIENIISFEDFAKLNLRVATIIKVEDIAGADKLYKLTIDVGELGQRTICAGLKPYYQEGELKEKQIIIVANLAPRKMRGIESQGMLLAASTKNHEKVILISPEKNIENGAKIN
jgi:methionine--tRNA ligase beta chain